MVFTKRQEIHRTKLIPKAACCKRQDHTEGRPMNTSMHRKQSLSDRRRRKLSSELFARTFWRKGSKETDIVTHQCMKLSKAAMQIS